MVIKDEGIYWKGEPYIPEGWLNQNSTWRDWLSHIGGSTLLDWLEFHRASPTGLGLEHVFPFVSVKNPNHDSVKIALKELEVRLPKITRVKYLC